MFGSAFTGTVSNCYVTGFIEISGNYKVGGLAGKGYANIYGCSVETEDGSKVVGTYIMDKKEGDNVGGLVGFRGEGKNTIDDYQAQNLHVEGTRKVGGLIGSVFNDNTIKNCSVASVTVVSNASQDCIDSNPATSAIGGLIGLYTNHQNAIQTGTLEDCTASDVVLKSDNPGVTMNPIAGGIRGTEGVDDVLDTIVKDDSNTVEKKYTVTFTVSPVTATVTVYSDEGIVRTFTGSGSLILYSGTYTFEASADGYISTGGPFRVDDGRLNITIALEEQIRLPIYDDEGEYIPMVPPTVIADPVEKKDDSVVACVAAACAAAMMAALLVIDTRRK